MKKVFATILALIYLSSSIGATVHLHYCMGKLMSWSLKDDAKASCTYCGMPKSSTKSCETVGKCCCKDEHKVIKAEKDQKASEFAFHPLKFSSLATVYLNNLSQTHLHSQIIEHPVANGPPLQKVPVFILNCVFRI